MRERIRIIANPVSGKGRGIRKAREVAELLRARGCAAELVETRQAGDARRLASEADGCAAVAAVGGDGTVNEVLNGLPDGPAIAMIPSGTANVLAKELGLPRSPAGLARVLADGREIRWDLAVDRVSGRKVLLFASAGYDAHVVHVFHAARKGPIRMWQYILWGLKGILGFEAPRIAVELDGRTVATDASWVQVSNVAAYGGPLVFTPRARPDDGRFEVMVLRGGGRRDVVRMFWRGVVGWALGIDLRLGGLSFHGARRVRLSSTQGLVPVQVDGDPGGHLPVDLELVPGGARVLAP